MTFTEGFTWSMIIGGGAVFVIEAIQGFVRRRPFWRRASWLRFGGAVGASLIVVLIGLGMVRALDNGLYRSAPNSRHLFIVATLGVMLVGAGALGLLLGWFGTGQPDRQFRLKRLVRKVVQFRTRAAPGKEPDELQRPISSIVAELAGRKTPEREQLSRPDH